MLQQQYRSTQSLYHFDATLLEPLNVLVYRSVAISVPTSSELQMLLQAAQRRNRAEGVTGVLVYENGEFFQWLEGAAEALDRVWESISQDPRHREIQVLRREPVSERVFEDWDLRIASGSRVSIEAAVAALSSPAVLRRVVGKPKNLLNLSLKDVFSTIVVPRLGEVHAHQLRPSPRPSTSKIWHAAIGSSERLANALMAPGSNGTRRYVDSLLDQGANLRALYHEVFEPAQRCLGKLWDAEQCDDFQLTHSLARLQMELHHVNSFFAAEHAFKPEHSVLLCSQPLESHHAGLAMSSEAFQRDGWAVSCEFPEDDRGLSSLLHARWFDVLKLSQSGSLRRDGRLTALRTTINSARSASLNPSLIVMVDGRTFVERPQVYRAVHANAMSASVLEGVIIADRLLAATRSLTALRQSSVA